MFYDDETQQSAGGRSLPLRLRLGTWARRVANATHGTRTEPRKAAAPSGRLSVRATLRALPTLLDGSSLPNGVVELLVDDFEAPTHQLFDIDDGVVTLVEPGRCVPWASIAGPATAWAMALGPERDATGLKLTGDLTLARRVLAALPSSD